jgi:outer membrane protein
MNRIFKSLNRTKDAEATINAAKDKAKKEFDARADAYKKKLNAINAMSAGAARDRAIADIKAMEKEINEFRTTREKELQDQALRLREGIVKQIEDFIGQRLIKDKQTMIFDFSGLSLSGMPAIVYWQDVPELSDQVIAGINNGAAENILPFPSTDALRFAVIDMKRACNAAPGRKQVEAAINAEKGKVNAELGDHASTADRAVKEKELEASTKVKRQSIVNRVVADVGAIGKIRGYQVIFDSSGESLNGVPIVLSSRGMPDVTAEVIADLGGKE